MKQSVIQLRLTIILCTVAVLIFSAILLVLKNSTFRGIMNPEQEISYAVDCGKIPYVVTNIKERNKFGGDVEYTIHFESVVEDAPAFDTMCNVVPAGMSLDSEYMAEWLNVSAVYSSLNNDYIREKDVIAMEYTGQTISEELIEETKAACKEVLIEDLKGVTNPVFNWFAIGVLGVAVVVCFLLAKVAENKAEKFVKEDAWCKLQQQLDSTYNAINSRTYFGIDVATVFIDENLPEPTLPFRCWANKAEYDSFMRSRTLVDLNKAKDENAKRDFRKTAQQAKNEEMLNKGIIPDIEVVQTADDGFTRTSPNLRTVTNLRQGASLRNRGTTVTRTTLPRSNNLRKNVSKQ